MGIAYNSKIVIDGLGFVVDFANEKSINKSTLSLTDIGPNKLSVSLTSPEANTVSLINGYALFSPADMSSTASYYTISNSYFNNIKNEITLETCVYVNNTNGSAQYCRPVSPRTTETSSPLGFGVGNGYIGYEVNTSSGWITGGTASSLCANNQWVHVTQTTSVTNNTFNTYVNGNLIQSLSLNSTTPNNGNGILIGRGFYGGVRNFSGRVSFVKVYNRALNPAEIAQNFAATRGRFGI